MLVSRPGRIVQNGVPYFSKGAASQRLSARRLRLPEFALALQLGELGLLRKDLIPPLLHCGLHGGERCGE